MYKIKCLSHGKEYDSDVFLNHCENEFKTIEDAVNAIHVHVLDRLNVINVENVKSRPFVFIPKLNVVHGNRSFVAAIYTRYYNRDEFAHGFYVTLSSTQES